MTDKQEKELTDLIHRSILSVYSNEEILLREAVEGKGKGKKIEKKTLLLGKYRLFILKKNFFGKVELNKNLPLIHITKIRLAEGFIVLDFGPLDSVVTFKINLFPNGKSLLTTLRKCIRKLTGDHATYEFDVPEDLQEDLGEYQQPVADGFSDAYDAYCNLYEKPVRPAVSVFVEDLYRDKRHDLPLNACPGADPRAEIDIDIASVLMPLARNNYFHAVELRREDRKDIVSVLGHVLASNTSISKLVLNECQINDVTPLAQALSANSNHVLHIIDLSKNDIDRGFVALVQALPKFGYAPVVLNFARCNLTTRSMTALFEQFSVNYAVSMSVEELNLAYNKFEEQSTLAFLAWLDKVKGYSRMKSLSVAYTGIDITRFSKSVLFNTGIEQLDLSGHRIDNDQLIEAVTDILHANHCLTKLALRHCHLTSHSVEAVVSAVIKNKKVTAVELDLAHNDLGLQGAAGLARALKDSEKVTKLNLSDTKIRGKGLLQICDVLVSPLDTLVIDAIGPLDTDPAALEQFWTSFVQFMLRTQLKRLRVRGSKTNTLKRQLIPLFDALRQNPVPSLLELDISGNQFGDVGAVELAALLKVNQSLRALHIDGNGLTLSGLRALHLALRLNSTLIVLPAPFNDLHRLETRHLAQVYAVWTDTSQLLTANRTAQREAADSVTMIGRPKSSRPAPDGVTVPHHTKAPLPSFFREETPLAAPTFESAAQQWKTMSTVSAPAPRPSDTTDTSPTYVPNTAPVAHSLADSPQSASLTANNAVPDQSAAPGASPELTGDTDVSEEQSSSDEYHSTSGQEDKPQQSESSGSDRTQSVTSTVPDTAALASDSVENEPKSGTEERALNKSSSFVSPRRPDGAASRKIIIGVKPASTSQSGDHTDASDNAQ